MRYTQIQRKSHDGIITIGEYITYFQPYTLLGLGLVITDNTIPPGSRNITEQILAAADVSGKDKYYVKIMTEPPFPGHGGLLPGEKEEKLF